MRYLIILIGFFLMGCSSTADKLAFNSLYPVSTVNKTEVPDPPINYSSSYLDDTHLWESTTSSPITIIYAHGNGVNLGTLKSMGMPEVFHSIGVNAVFYDYPGYGRSKGSPSEKSLVASTTAAIALAKKHWPGSKIYLWGRSVGAGVVIQAAKIHEDDLSGLILTSPFTSFRAAAIAKTAISRLVSDSFFKEHGYNSKNAAYSINLRVLIHHGDADKLIPYSHGVELSQTFKNSKFITLKGRGHNDVFNGTGIFKDVVEFLTK